MQCPCKKKVTIGTGRKSGQSERVSSPLFVSILVFKSVLETNSGFCLLFTVLVIKDFTRGIRKPSHRITWKTLIWLSDSLTALASRRERTPALSDATREPSAKTLQKDIMLKALQHQKPTLANHHSPSNHFCPKDTFCPWEQ